MDFTSNDEQINYLFHHLFLPAKLPGQDDDDGSNTIFLVDFVLHSLKLFIDESVSEDVAIIKTAIWMLKHMRDATDKRGFLAQSGVQNALKSLSENGPAALFHVTAQNAGLLLRKTDDSVCFETFEISPTNSAAMSTKGRLIRQFPANATVISRSDFQNKAFQEALTNTLVKMSHQTVSETQPKAKKAKQDHIEDRETTDPRIVTELLASILQGIGEPVEPTGICKNTREEISYTSSRIPWRRSPVWLLIRVGLHLTMSRLSGGSDEVYKRFMVYLMAQVLHVANSKSVPSEFLHVMMTKISRRLCKLQSSPDGKWLSTIQTIVTAASTCLRKRWENICNHSEKQLDLQALSEMNMADNILFSIPEMDTFLASIAQRDSNDQTSTFSPKAHVVVFGAETLPMVDSLNDNDYKSFSLAMIETWVQDHLNGWIKTHIGDESSCSALKLLLQNYHASAKNWYASRPEGASRMLLTIGELWIAADKAACHAYPMLRLYDAEVPTDVWQALLLQSKADMGRLHTLETYLLDRKRATSRPSVFRSYGDPYSFPVQYFENSATLQSKKAEIERKAEQDKESKIKEFSQLKDQYDELVQRYESQACGQVSRTEMGVTYLEHDRFCRRCSLKSEAADMQIRVHEWPLPMNTREAQTVVFELGVPSPFAAWRDLTFYFINDVLGYRSDGRRPESSYPLDSYNALARWCTTSGNRVHLLSEAKPHLETHRRMRYISQITGSDVCLNNGLVYQYSDRRKDNFISPFTSSLAVSNLCTFQLPSHAEALKPFLVRTWLRPDGETPNQVIASQSKCPDHMTLGEYKALAVLPFGYRLQWMSILTQLAMPTIDFNKAETAIFLLQMSLQAGPYSASEITREAHTRLVDPEFGRQMLKSIANGVGRVERNWESHNALCSFTFLATRLLSLADPTLSRSICGLLEHCRNVSYQWLMTLINKVQGTTDDVQRREFSETALNIALICVETFNIDDEPLQSEVLADPQQASVLVEASIVIYNNFSLKKESRDSLYDIVLDRVRHTLHRSRPVLVREVVSSGNACLDLAIERRWPAFSRTTKWSVVPSTCYWFETTSGRGSVHLSILTGELLVNGSPFSRLPRDYELHNDYQRLFGSLILDVTPSDLPGMRFSATRSFHGYIVHFGMQDNDLLVRLDQKGSTKDLVPPRVMRRSLPHRFVDNYAHWLHGETGRIEFCKLSNPWAIGGADDWYFERDDISWKLGCDRMCLIAPSSQLAKRLAAIFNPLEDLFGLHIVYDIDNKSLEIQIPSLQLEFLLKSGESIIKSRQFRDMHIDANQSIGTLVGFYSKLVLCGSQNSTSRMVIIPEGDVCYEREVISRCEKHTAVTVAHGSARRVQPYKIDDLLCRLVASTKVESKFFLAYIHALTSFCLPDPFLKRTGTEEAFEILESASVRAPCVLNEVAYQRLGLIADLSPSRSYYPKHETVMQVVNWSSGLSFLSQDDRFYRVTREIFARSHEVNFLYPKHEVPDAPDRSSMPLVDRAIVRASREQVSGFGAEEFTAQPDVRYIPRDRGQVTERIARTREIVSRIYGRHCSLSKDVESSFAMDLYRLLSEGVVVVQDQMPHRSMVYYDSKWLQSPGEFLSSDWCRLHYAFRTQRDWLNRFELIIWLATVSYSKEHSPNVTQALLMLAQSASVSATPLPLQTSYDLSDGWSFVSGEVNNLANNAAISIDSSPEASLSPLWNETGKQILKRRRNQFQNNRRQAVGSFHDALKQQWPCETPRKPTDDKVNVYLRTTQAMKVLEPKWTAWYNNLRFKMYLDDVVSRLREVPVETLTLSPLPPKTEILPRGRPLGFVSIEGLFSSAPPLYDHSHISKLHVLVQVTKKDSEVTNELAGVIDSLDRKAKLQYEHHYLRELRESLASLREHHEHEMNESQLSKHGALFKQHLEVCASHTTGVYQSLSEGIINSMSWDSGARVPHTIRRILKDSEYLPRVTPLLLLQQLRSSRCVSLSGTWQTTIIDYAVSITSVQQAKRLIRFQSSHGDLLRELENTGHIGWKPLDHPEWLLLECESEIMIRNVQQRIAQQMITPPDKANAVMQLNMGEGKSTVIVPIVATALGDRSKLVRVIVAKPQAKQMHQMLVSKLAGLLDRPVYLLPFSRDIRLDHSRACTIQRLMTRCMKEGGVLMVQPEHLLSFQLMELECQLSSQVQTADQMRKTRDFFDGSSRDIVDESDENFSVKFELIYTLGQQRPIEDSPGRWVVMQEVLGLIAKFAGKAKSEFPKSLEFDHRHSERYPRIRFLRPEAEQVILSRVATSICETGMSGFPIVRQPQRTRGLVHRYITHWELRPEDIQTVEESLFWDETTIGHILLLRGLFAGGILAFALGQKRWRVNYGVDPHRETGTKLAVPFRAKDNPTPRSEFSHPDVVIALTCLSYYYSGLNDDALFSAFTLLTRSDNAKLEYQDWVKTAPILPPAFRTLEGVNLRDRVQCVSEIFPYIRYSKSAIDYYLGHLVFAKESKEFPYKLSASGWDLGKTKANPTTGFSGTNDSRYVLPLDIKQLDLPEQKHTNALVLDYLLRPENGIALMPSELQGVAFDSQTLLRVVAEMSANTRVILDVGAQVIDLDNLEFSKLWLACYKDDATTQAVICFSEQDEIIVLDRSGKVEELQTSPFAEQMDQCLVFLDEAHTRGTDLKLPTSYRAVVTLGAGLTKDRLVQACMRMRKLGKGQTVEFCIPWEIEQKIIELKGREDAGKREISVSDVLCWVITETCLDLRKAIPLWLNQGVRFSRQREFWLKASKSAGSQDTIPEWAELFLEDEAQTLDQRYRPQHGSKSLALFLDNVDGSMSAKFRSRCDEFGLTELRTSSLQEEQERELSPETEQERQVEKPPPAEPADHSVTNLLRNWISHGSFPDEHAVFNNVMRGAFKTLEDTSAATHFNIHDFPNHVRVTADFARTVKATFGLGNYSDSFQRPVQWVLTSKTQTDQFHLVVISPYEAQELLPSIDASQHVALHLYAPRANLGFESLDHLSLYSVMGKSTKHTAPRDVIVFLNLFAGQLYLTSFEDYVSLCDSLGLAWGAADDSVILGPDGFIPLQSNGSIINKSGFSKSPIQFLRVLIEKIRQDCAIIEKTDMGKIIEGVRLLQDDFRERE
ncbi:hypothetical protein FSARC_5098 [Fusarium sarcochroum]|uniref:ubiquitinyl hydrolase 1 n=1 Tax=Fusarium sarcochroum TaxID=1208366 RepID=A0A8H4U087_9HYPO|nr:hypothetical protein FSARC_5098 [Fusarium sarcochroum]